MRFINAESNNKVLLDGAAGVIGCLAEGTSQICFFFCFVIDCMRPI